jgi:hypothetical protein
MKKTCLKKRVKNILQSQKFRWYHTHGWTGELVIWQWVIRYGTPNHTWISVNVTNYFTKRSDYLNANNFKCNENTKVLEVFVVAEWG